MVTQLPAILAAHALWLATGGEQGTRANLEGEDLAGCDLSDQDLRRAKLSAVNLDGANLQRARLEDADLRQARLERADLSEARLDGADLRRASLAAAVLSAASCERAQFEWAHLQSANLSEARLQSALLTQADLAGADLVKARLQGATLVRANLRGADLHLARLDAADLSAANLEDATLTGAHLPEASLRGATLREADFRGADLTHADLREATGIAEIAFQGAELRAAQFSPDQVKFEGLSNVAEAARNAGKLFVTMLTGCAYAWIVIATTTDAALITNSGAAKLPLIDTEIPVDYFYAAAPAVLVGLSLYFHLYLQRFWELLADLPAVFPDGVPLDKKVYPWTMNGLIYQYLTGFQDDQGVRTRPPLMSVQIAASHLFGWGVIPITLLLFWGKYLRSHAAWVTGWHVLLLAVSVGMSRYYQSLTRITLQGNAESLDLRRDAQWNSGSWGYWVALALTLVSLMAIWGDPYERGILRNFVDLRDAELSTKPAGWTGKAEVQLTRHGPLGEEEIALIKKANLRSKNLRHARASRALLINADLRRADLTQAILEGAHLRNANLEDAQLPGAILREADLRGAKLSRAELRGAQLARADLRGADLSGATLGQPGGAATGPDFLDAALFDSRTRWPTGFPLKKHHALRVEPGADLRGANLRGIDLRDADLSAANLSTADLRDATLTHVQNLGKAKLTGARYNPATRWPPAFDPRDPKHGLKRQP